MRNLAVRQAAIWLAGGGPMNLGEAGSVEHDQQRAGQADDTSTDLLTDRASNAVGANGRTDASVRRAKRVLVVEDDESVSSLLVDLLEDRGYRAIAALDGQTAVDLAREHQPDLITLDLALPGSDGHEVLASLKADPRTRDIPIVVISAFTQILPAGERKKLAYLLGKPFDVTEVLEIVQATVGNPYV